MSDRIGKESSEPPEFIIATKDEVYAHVFRLRELAKVVNRTYCHLIEFELQIRSSVHELEVACLNASVTDLHKTKELLTAREVARKVGVPLAELLRDRDGRFPKPIRRSSRQAVYKRADVDSWLLKSV